MKSWGFAALLLASVAAAPALAQKDELVVGVSQFPSTMHPAIDPEVIKTYVLGFGLRPISVYDKDWKLACLYCTEVPSLDNGLAETEGDGMTVKVKLKPGMKWGDGTKMTVRDLEVVWKIGHDDASGFADPSYWMRVSRIEMIDDLTAVMHLKEVWTQYALLPTMLPAHIEGPIYDAQKAPGDYIKQTAFARTPTNPGLYAGPYKVTGYESGSRVILEPNPHWWGNKPYFKRIVVRTIDNTAALQANLLSGDIDMAPGDAPSLTIDQVLALRKQQPDRFNYVFRPALTYEHIDLNLDDPILKDIRVRRALLMAIDRKTLVDRLFEGLQPVAATFVNPLDPMYAGQPAVAYDPAGARALLAEAGWKPGDDGICRNAAGDRLMLEFRTTAGNRLRELQQAVMKDQWKGVCVEALIKNDPARVFFGETMKKRQFGAMGMYAWTTAISYPPRQTLHSVSIPTAANNWGGSNYPGLRSAEMDAAIVVSETSLDPAKQKAAWATMQKVYAEQVPVLPLFYRAESYALPKWLKGLEPTGHNFYSSFWAENWRAQ